MKMNAVYAIGGSVAVFLVLVPLTISAEEMMCTMQYEPVCGARTVKCVKAPCYPVYETFGNRCVLDSADAIFIHKGECSEEEIGPYRPESANTGVVPKAKESNQVKIAIDGVPLTTVNVDLSNTDTNRAVTIPDAQTSDPKLVTLWKGLWSRVSGWLRM